MPIEINKFAEIRQGELILNVISRKSIEPIFKKCKITMQMMQNIGQSKQNLHKTNLKWQHKTIISVY